MGEGALMAIDPHELEDEALNDPGILIGAIIVLGLLAAIILAVLWRDERRTSLDRAFEPVVIHERK